MPNSAKPRHKRGGFLRSRRPKVARPLPHEVDLVFRPLDLIFAQLRAGEIDAYRGAPVFRSFEGELCEVCPALEGWIETWALLDSKFRLGIDVAALITLRKKLVFGVPLTPEEVESAAEVVNRQRLAYARDMDVYEVKSVSRTAEIKLELEAMNG